MVTSEGRDSSVIERVIANFLHECERGVAPDREKLLAEHPDLAEDLRGFFEHRDRMQAMVDPLRSAAVRVLNVRCPHCNSSIELNDDKTLQNIVCPECSSDFSLVDSRVAPPAGLESIGHFQLVEQVGVGQFGAVWKAKDLALERTVAIKIPRNRQMSATDVDVFLRDARVAAQLRHPNIASVHEVGKHEGAIYIVSDFIQGETLNDWVGTHPLSVRRTVKLCQKITAALHYAHTQGVIHRDLKPGNIMIDLAGEPHLVDFGLARRETGELTVTMDGQILGTPAYMSPEQARGESHRASRGADIYSLGVVLFELLTGELPFRGNRQMLLTQILEDAPPRLRRLNSKIPPDLETICLKCLEKEPSNRYATAGELGQELQRFLDGKPVVARPVSPLIRILRWCRRNTFVASLLGAVALLLIAIAVVSSLGYVQTQAALTESRKNADTIEQNLYCAEMLRAGNVATLPNGLAEVHRLTSSWKTPVSGVDRRGWEWHHLEGLLHQDLVTLPHPTEMIEDCRWNDQGTLLASITQAGVLRVWTSEAQILHKFQPYQQAQGLYQYPNRVAWNHAGNMLCAYGRDGIIHLYALDCDEILRKLVVDSPVTQANWSEDDEQLITVAAKLDDDGEAIGAIRARWIVETGEVLSTQEFPLKNATTFSWSDNGKLIASVPYSGPVSIWNVESNQLVCQLGGETPSISAVSWYPDNRRIAFGNRRDLRVVLADAETGQQLHSVKSVGAPGYFPSQMAETLLAFSDGNREVQVRDVSKPIDEESGRFHGVTLRGHRFRVTATTFHPSKNLIATGSVDGDLKIWNSKPSNQGLSGSTCIAWHKDGRKCATRNGGQIHVLDLDTQEEDVFYVGKEQIADMCWSHDGSKIACISYDTKVTVTSLEDKEVQHIGDSQLRPQAAWLPDLIAWNSSRNQFAVVHDAQTIRVHDLDTNQDLFLKADTERQLLGLAFDPTGRLLATGGEGSTLRVWAVDSGDCLEEVSLPGGDYLLDVGWNPDGSKIACACSGIGILLYDRFNKEERWKQLAGHATSVFSVSWSPDGSRIVSSDDSGKVIVWDPVAGQQVIAFHHPGGGVPRVRWSPDGSTLAAAAFRPSELGSAIMFWSSGRSAHSKVAW